MLSFRFFWLFILFCVTLSAQTSKDFSDMLSDGQQVLFSQPQQSVKIAQHVIQNSESAPEIIQAHLLSGIAYYVTGEFEKMVTSTLEAKKLAEATKNVEQQLEINAFGIYALNLFGLDLAAEKYFEFTEAILTSEDKQTFTNYLQGGKALLLAHDLIEQENYTEALSRLSLAKGFFEKIPNLPLVNQTQILLTEVYAKALPPYTAFEQLNEVLGHADDAYPNDFQKMIVLHQLGEVHFMKKEYSQAIESLEQALFISEKLPNKRYRYAIVESLAINYMALEDSDNFYSFKETAAILSNEVETDEDNAVNSVFNYTNANHTGKRDLVASNHQRNLVIVAGVLLLILLTWGTLKVRYRYRTDQYQKFLDYFENREKRKEQNEEPKKEPSKSTNIPKETEQMLIEKLAQFENSVHFTKQDMSLALLASQFDTNTKYLSEVINTHKDKNFNSYINELRINYIIDKLKHNSTYLHYKISYLAEESGFSSHSSFATVFKSVTGIPPTVFIDLLNAQQHSSDSRKAYETV
ncbi:AraC family transcriptional regulator [Altibacter sp.]|uniref:helix-turn-helix domain-containing protein n=1 Tax=Altibacter sp. TaxID=2024823 RepID=UPI00258FB5BC|nr:AraC family transcriptional regulator [Altibacter sp.]MCW9037523.1 helix-turn-helix domain-containing protein [Altibacter sp.]